MSSFLSRLKNLEDRLRNRRVNGCICRSTPNYIIFDNASPAEVEAAKRSCQFCGAVKRVIAISDKIVHTIEEAREEDSERGPCR